MRIIPLVILILTLIPKLSYAYLLPPPPVIDDTSIYKYMKWIYDTHNVVEEVDESPNGNVRGKKNELRVYDNSGTAELYINTDGDKEWQKLN